jgi:PhzF family phenazine biosynthesis protein
VSTLPFYWVDAFTDRPFGGNPAAVVPLERWLPDAELQRLAAQHNLSETAYFVAEGASRHHLRWFTPAIEVDLCGHATLASAHVLWDEGLAGRNKQLAFHTKSGVLRAERLEKSGEVWIELDFPSAPETPFKGDTSALAKAVGARSKYVGTYGQDALFEVEDEATVRKVSPDMALLKALPFRGVAVTSLPGPKSNGYDFVSRFFAPKVGISEDPVTGSAHCGLGPFWAKRLKKKELTGYQASARGGSVKVRPEGERVFLGGQAVTTLRAELEA